jgi:hypothetical protein
LDLHSSKCALLVWLQLLLNAQKSGRVQFFPQAHAGIVAADPGDPASDWLFVSDVKCRLSI